MQPLGSWINVWMEILKRVVNNKLRMVYYLIVYTVLLVQFPKQNVGPPINKTWIRHWLLLVFFLDFKLNKSFLKPVKIKRAFHFTVTADQVRFHGCWLNSTWNGVTRKFDSDKKIIVLGGRVGGVMCYVQWRLYSTLGPGGIAPGSHMWAVCWLCSICCFPILQGGDEMIPAALRYSTGGRNCIIALDNRA